MSSPSESKHAAMDMPQPDIGRRSPARARRSASPEAPLRRDVRMLGFELGHVLHRHAPEGLYELVERVRKLAKQRRAGTADAEGKLCQLLAELDYEQLGELIRALTCFLDLANLAEDRHRIRVLRQRERALAPAPQAESIGAAIIALQHQGLDADAMQQLLDKLDIELVFTAHPTEAKRRTVRNTLNRLRDDLVDLDRTDVLPRERRALLSRIRADLDCLWETDTLRPRKPTVIEEVRRSLFALDSIWQVGPRLYRAMREALADAYPERTFRLPVFLRFGTWIGGDRDGHPFVTTDVTIESLMTLRRAAIEKHLEQCRELTRVLSVSERRHPITPDLRSALNEAIKRWPTVELLLAELNPHEKYRHWLVIVKHRLMQTVHAEPGQPLPEAAYAGPNELANDLNLVGESLRENNFHRLADGAVQDWLDRVAMFGFHLARMDIREDAGKLNAAVGELMQQLDIEPDYATLNEPSKQARLTEPVPPAVAQRIDVARLSADTRQTLDLFMLMQRTVATLGREALGTVIASMTHHPSDVLAMLWLGRLAATRCEQTAAHESSESAAFRLPIVPLFETINDLKRSSAILETLLSCEPYVRHLRATGNRQLCMIGYSDSTKDGGFLAANWCLHQAQRELSQVAKRHGVEVAFFHGRGGSLGRGGGPAARGILTLPPEAVDGRLRVTEQGEVLAERYDDPQVAYRHLEQVTWATLLVSAKSAEPVPEQWRRTMDRAADASERVYRELLETPGFISYFEHATPIEVIESLPIGSRPSRRQAQRDLSTLRAIPYTFAWTQSRHMLTAYFGLGGALNASAAGDWANFREMYQHWPLFRSIIDNAELGLAKCDRNIIHQYARLVPDASISEKLVGMVVHEIDRTCDALQQVTGRPALLDAVVWLQRSVQARNPYVDALNFIQIELIHRFRQSTASEAQLEQLAELLRLSVQGIAAGLRTTG
ncbi:phosphoenolpyruvate carboxylase [Phycisphaerales bacterium AB-hyl4]|uniref:Phosphoenolpyruvate carboxylase n=1 Tax=Natronomicrosphaera hydrolytica TaxID=3242702 RepID=A0ABV4U1P5_9BACT